MTEKPILFSAPMVQAILNGTKTQTRRIASITDPMDYPGDAPIQFVEHRGKQYWWNSQLDHPAHILKACPYGQPGGHLWVKETSRLHLGEEENLIQYRADNSLRDIPSDWFSNDPVLYRWIAAQSEKPLAWRPAIHMPRKASRLTLEIASVRVERLNDITPEDAIAEGIEAFGDDMWKNHFPNRKPDLGWIAVNDPVMSYRSLWESINGIGSWNENPWVWVVEFKRVERATA